MTSASAGGKLPPELLNHPGYARVFQPEHLTFDFIGPLNSYQNALWPTPADHALRELWLRQQEQGVSHVALHFKPQRRPAAEMIDELGEHLLPLFPSHEPGASA